MLRLSCIWQPTKEGRDDGSAGEVADGLVGRDHGGSGGPGGRGLRRAPAGGRGPMTKALQSPLAFRTTVAAVRGAGRVSGRLAGAAAARLWFTPWPVPVSERAVLKQRAWLEDATTLTFTTRSGHRL